MRKPAISRCAGPSISFVWRLLFRFLSKPRCRSTLRQSQNKGRGCSSPMGFRQGRGPLGGEDGPEPRPGLCAVGPGGVEAGGQDCGAQSSRDNEARTVQKARCSLGSLARAPRESPPSQAGVCLPHLSLSLGSLSAGRPQGRGSLQLGGVQHAESGF